MVPDVHDLLDLPAAERLRLAEMLINSVGYPPDIDAADLPAWRHAEIRRLLDRFVTDDPGAPA